MSMVRITRDIISPACGDHPDLLIVAKWAVGELVYPEDRNAWPAYVSLKTTCGKVEVIGLNLDEFEAAGEAS